jgi:hypothetical protein
VSDKGLEWPQADGEGRGSSRTFPGAVPKFSPVHPPSTPEIRTYPRCLTPYTTQLLSPHPSRRSRLVLVVIISLMHPARDPVVFPIPSHVLITIAKPEMSFNSRRTVPFD